MYVCASLQLLSASIDSHNQCQAAAQTKCGVNWAYVSCDSVHNLAYANPAAIQDSATIQDYSSHASILTYTVCP